ncbi:F-box protein At3g07870-like [Papaver somniferum]|uniref:F-box protein At3g07870-like n=1 Tax=Papaver somniferum TaxID=3469 RepID=UPI000E6F8F16|nr:F-box protein At3g07870-like [Papaver somniferum]
MDSLPTDILVELLSRVPVESILECKLVCKRFGTLTRGSEFTKMHLRRQLQVEEPCLFFACRISMSGNRTLLFNGGQVSDRISVDEKYIYNQNLKRVYHPRMHNNVSYNHLVGSCNGLVCAFQHHHSVIDPIYICNPLTREYVYLPQLVEPDLGRVKGGEVYMYGRIACGFGYVKSTDEYKVVRIRYKNNGFADGNVEVYTLGSGRGWRALGTVLYGLEKSGTYANDAIYWISYDKVVAFDLANEEFRFLPVPPYMKNRDCGLVALGRHLCLYINWSNAVEICYLIESSESKETWCTEFFIDLFEAVTGFRGGKFQPILLTNNGEIIFLCDESVLYCYDTKTTILKMISNDASTDYIRHVEAIAHINTFASLEATGENSKKYTTALPRRVPRPVRTPWDDVADEVYRVAPNEEIDTTCFGFEPFGRSF